MQQRSELFVKIQKKIVGGGGEGSGWEGVRVEAGCERRIKVFVKIHTVGYLNKVLCSYESVGLNVQAKHRNTGRSP